MTEAWFPRPEGVADITRLPGAAPLPRGDLFELLSSPDATEWREKVGVAGAADGSGKSSTRLLVVDDHVFKTRLDLEHATMEDAMDWAAGTRRIGERAGVWHPSKQWFVARVGDRWLPVSACDRLETLRSIDDLERRLAGWIEMLALGLEVAGRTELGLDLNPSNFAREPGGEQLYYIDDEFYPSASTREVAGAIASRIPEEPRVSAERWRAWIEAVIERIPDLPWADLAAELGRYPLAERYLTPLAVMIDTVARHAARSRSRVRTVRPPRPLVCVLADIHANLPALSAVLDEARALGADRFLVLGDVVGYGPHPRECVDVVAELPAIAIIRGNHDHAIATGELALGMNRLARQTAQWCVEELDKARRRWLGELPVEHVDDNWMAVHGAPKDPRKFLAYVYELTYEDNLAHLRSESMPLCFYGHTHVQLVHLELPSGPTKRPGTAPIGLREHTPLLINPGSVGQPRDGDWRASFALWDRGAETVSFHRASYDIERTIADLAAAGLPSELAVRLRGGR